MDAYFAADTGSLGSISTVEKLNARHLHVA